MPNYIKFDTLEKGELWQEAAWNVYLGNYPDRELVKDGAILGITNGRPDLKAERTTRLVNAIPHISDGSVIYPLSNISTGLYNSDVLNFYSGTIITDPTGYLGN